MKISASNLEEFKEIDDTLKMLSEEFLKIFQEAEISSIGDYIVLKTLYFNRNNIVYFPAGMVPYMYVTETINKCNNEGKTEKRYNVSIAVIYKGKCLCMNFLEKYNPDINFRFQPSEQQ